MSLVGPLSCPSSPNSYRKVLAEFRRYCRLNIQCTLRKNQLHASFRCGTTGPAAQPFQCFAKMELNPNKVEKLVKLRTKVLKAERSILVV